MKFIDVIVLINRCRFFFGLRPFAIADVKTDVFKAGHFYVV